MNLSLTKDQALIREAAERFLAEASDSAAVRRAMETSAGYDEAVWRRIAAELGWCAMAVPEAHGGLGLGTVENALLLEQMGRRLLCAPYFSTVCLAANLLLECATEHAHRRFLPRIAAGELRATATLACTPLSARRAGSGWTLQGTCRLVLDGATAETVFALARVEGENAPVLFALPGTAPGLRRTALKTWDLTRRYAALEIEGVRLDAEARVDDPARSAEGLRRAQALASLYLAAEQLGGAQACLELTLAYTQGRKQFGRTIASFQAVKHRCAEMMVKIEAARSMVYGAAALGAGRPATDALVLECAAAKALASEVYFWCAQEAIQLHGGVGFTWEYDPQLHFKRAQAGFHWLGAPDALREYIVADIGSPLSLAAEGGSQGRAGAGSGGLPRFARPHPNPCPACGRGEEELRAEVAAWLREHLGGRFAVLKHRGGPGDEDFEPALRKEWERELAKGGWTCVGWPEEYGGRGLTIEQQVIFHEEYARAGGPGRMGHIGEGLLGPTLIAYGSREQKRRFLPRILDGSEYWAQGYSEPNAGSDLANVQTRCRLDEARGEWIVDGQKVWTSLAHESDWIFVLARCQPGSKGSKGLAFLLIPLNQPGVTIRPIRQLTGSCEFNEVFFDGARTAADNIVGKPGEGWTIAMALLGFERGRSTLGQQMHFAHELELVTQCARESGAAGEPAIRSRLAQSWIGLRAMRYNALRMLAGSDDGRLRPEATIYKYYWSNWHRELGKLAMDVLGAEGNVVHDDEARRRLQQVFFFSRADTIYAGTNEIQLNLIAERALGMPREPRGEKA